MFVDNPARADALLERTVTTDTGIKGPVLMADQIMSVIFIDAHRPANMGGLRSDD